MGKESCAIRVFGKIGWEKLGGRRKEANLKEVRQ